MAFADGGGADWPVPDPALVEPAVPFGVAPGGFSGAGEGEQSGVLFFL
ncbi:MAG: hypothetical protein WCD47_14565 [Candidatus Sulfotelmatobacter sp.]